MKNIRHDLILKLVTENVVTTQEDLQLLLAKNGSDVTQATISRDIKQLALIKTATSSGETRYAVPALKRDYIENKDSMILTIISDAVKSVDYALNTVVVKCSTGMAQAVCSKLDTTQLDNVVGTLAGDDTIFILMRTERDAYRLVKELDLIIKK